MRGGGISLFIKYLIRRIVFCLSYFTYFYYLPLMSVLEFVIKISNLNISCLLTRGLLRVPRCFPFWLKISRLFLIIMSFQHICNLFKNMFLLNNRFFRKAHGFGNLGSKVNYL
jgi:hypothetical protein